MITRARVHTVGSPDREHRRGHAVSGAQQPAKNSRIHTLARNHQSPFFVQNATAPLTDYLDAEAHYELRPPPHGRNPGATGRRYGPPDRDSFGSGRKRQIVAFWGPIKNGFSAGTSQKASPTRLNWGMTPPARLLYTSQVSRTLGRTWRGCRAVKPGWNDRRKFVIRLEGATLAEPECRDVLRPM